MGYKVIIFKLVGVCKRCGKRKAKLVHTKSAGKKLAGKVYGRAFHFHGCHKPKVQRAEPT